jgi:23S rRNA (pseudouridine1915-N3)-methyltransferase
MAVHVVAVGRVRDPGLRAACDGWVARARHYFPLTVHEVADAGRKGPTAATSMRIEGKRLVQRVPEGAVIVACTREGKALDSKAFAARLERWRSSGRVVAFLLGGAFGLAPDLCTRAELRLALSAFTMPHELARAVLLEQLYRAGTMLRGEPYHKGPA